MASLHQSEQIEYEMMLLNYVANEIKDINLQGTDPDEESKVVVRLSNHILSKLQEADDPSHRVSIILERYFEKIERKLRYKGRTKIKADVLRRFKAIADYLRSQDCYKIGFNKKQLENIIKTVLVDPDPRVLREYLISVEGCTGRTSYYRSEDVRPFVCEVIRLVDGDLE